MAKHVSRRNFMGGMAAAVGYLSTRPGAELWAQGGPRPWPHSARGGR